MPILSNFPSGSAYLQAQITALDEKIDSKDLKYFELSLPVSGWSDATPSEQTVTVTGLSADWKPIDPVLLSSGTWETDELARESFALVDMVETGTDSVTFTCYGGVPETDLSIGLYVYWEAAE